MFWLYFVRDFYRVSPASTQSSAAVARKMQEKNHYVLHSALTGIAFKKVEFQKPAAPKPTVCTPIRDSVEPVTLSNYLQRWSLEADQSFGIWDPQVGFSMFSANFERVTGLLSGDCAGHDWIHSIHHDQQYAVNDALLNAIQGVNGRCLVQVECQQNGWRWLMLDIKAPAPKQPYIMVLWRDLSEQKALEEALKQVESSLAVSERSRSAFLSSMSHELRTPLNAIMGFSEMMKSGVLGDLNNPTYQQYVDHIHTSGATLLQKISDLIDMASLEAGAMDLEDTELTVKDLIQDVIAIHSHQAFERGQSVILDCADSIAITGDRAKLICAIAHLLGNALRHSSDMGEVIISVRTNPDDGLVLSVRDSGEGIAPVQLQLIRDALAADVAYHNIEPGGIGLGLSLAKELAARHNGKVMIDSLRYRGSVVSMILPPERVVSAIPQKRRARAQLSVVAD